jgi:hypothetical protein
LPENEKGGHAAIIVIWLGFEPRTHSLEGCCSIQLSYQTFSTCKITFFFAILQTIDVFNFVASPQYEYIAVR